VVEETKLGSNFLCFNSAVLGLVSPWSECGRTRHLSSTVARRPRAPEAMYIVVRPRADERPIESR
jgi:hypothetical protein